MIVNTRCIQLVVQKYRKAVGSQEGTVSQREHIIFNVEELKEIKEKAKAILREHDLMGNRRLNRLSGTEAKLRI